MVQPDFKRYSPSEFFKENLELLGYTGKLRALTTLVNEGVTNAIDAAERLWVLPDLYVAIRSVGKDPNHYRIVIEDNASGVPEDSVLKMFEMFSGSKTHQNAQSRGRGFGIGISGALLFAQTVSGEFAKITTSTENDNEINYYEITLDSVKNEAKIIDYEKIGEPETYRKTKERLATQQIKTDCKNKAERLSELSGNSKRLIFIFLYLRELMEALWTQISSREQKLVMKTL